MSAAVEAQHRRSSTLLAAGWRAVEHKHLDVARRFLEALEREGEPTHYRELHEAIRIAVRIPE